MKCPDCQAEVDPDQDFCLECGEPIAGAKPAVLGKITKPASAPATALTPPTGQPVAKPAQVAKAAVSATPNPATTTLPATKAAMAKAKLMRRAEEPEPARCPGCGLKSTKERCPSCGTRLRPSED